MSFCGFSVFSVPLWFGWVGGEFEIRNSKSKTPRPRTTPGGWVENPKSEIRNPKSKTPPATFDRGGGREFLIPNS
jgi:hypothetical protein